MDNFIPTFHIYLFHFYHYSDILEPQWSLHNFAQQIKKRGSKISKNENLDEFHLMQ
jgi:hypothetical protein